METKFLYCVHDIKAKMYMDPFVAFNDQIAMRDFQRNCMDRNSPLCVFADDYELVCVGTFGILDGHVHEIGDSPTVICRASAFKKGDE